MATTITPKHASKHRLVYELAGDGTATKAPISNATLVADALATGPLRTALIAAYANQAAARLKFLYGNPIRMRITLQTPVQDITATANQPAVDVDVSGTDVVIDTYMGDTTGQVAILEIEYVHSLID